MYYQRQKTTKLPRHLALTMLPVALAMLLFFSNAHMPQVLQNFGHVMASPIWYVRDTILRGVDVSTGSLTNRGDLFRENQKLREELLHMQRTNFAASSLLAENEELRALLGRTTEDNMYLPATVINDTSYSPYDSFVIDVGENNNLREGMLVTTTEGLAVGSISSTLRNSAIVTLFSAPNTLFTATIQASTTIHARVTGQGGGTMLLSVPRDILVKKGNVILLPNFPGNPIGKISKVEVAPEDAYQTVYVLQAVNQHNLRYVLVDLVHTWKPDRRTEDEVENEPPVAETTP